MKLRTAKYMISALLVGSLAFGAPAFAKRDHDDHGNKHKDKHHERYDEEEYRSYNTKIINVYVDSHRDEYKRHRGWFKKHYKVGDRIREKDIVVVPIEIERQLRPVRGYRYVMVNDDIALISETTQNIVDVIAMFSR